MKPLTMSRSDAESSNTALSCQPCPTSTASVSGMITTDATDGALGTTNITVPVTPSLVAVTVTWPGRRALTYPAVDTVAMIVSEDVHVTGRPTSTYPAASRNTALTYPKPDRVRELGMTVTVLTAAADDPPSGGVISLRPHAAAKAIAAHPHMLTNRCVTRERLRQPPGRHGARTRCRPQLLCTNDLFPPDHRSRTASARYSSEAAWVLRPCACSAPASPLRASASRFTSAAAARAIVGS